MISFVLSSSINVILPSIAPIWIASISYSFKLETLFFSNSEEELLVLSTLFFKLLVLLFTVTAKVEIGAIVNKLVKSFIFLFFIISNP